MVTEQNREIVERLWADELSTVSEGGSAWVALIQVRIAKAGMLVVTTSGTFDVRQMIGMGRTVNPEIGKVAGTQSEEEA
ncbi:MAG: hypothetical protein M0Z47_02860 [Actinomycetota bacterium]|nr:hypothetical protein [Actinomycetota bacterium]